MIPKFFIKHPKIAIVISILMVVVGTVAMTRLPVAQFPEIVPPEIMTLSIYTGADSKTVEQSVATPIESQLSGVDHMNYMYSTNDNNGWSVLTGSFDLGTDPNIDQILTQLRVDRVMPQLPVEVNAQGVQVMKALSAPLMVLTLYSPHGTYDQNFLFNYSVINLKDELARVPGVGRVEVLGGEYAMRVWVQPDKLAKLSVTVPEIVQAIQLQNKNNPTGKIGGDPAPPGQEFAYTVLSQGRLTTPEEFGDIVIRANPDGSTLRLRDVARIDLGSQIYNMNDTYNGMPAGNLVIYQLPGSNAVDAAAGVRAKLDELSGRYPYDLKCDVALDTTKAVTAGTHEIVTTLFASLVLVILVVYVFLQGWRPAMIPLAAVPVSLIGTFIVFPLLGFSINTLSLFGLILAIGLVVDDAIVVVEAVQRHIEEGLDPREATTIAMEEVSGPIVAIALILTAVFVPTAFIPGISGRLYQQFAVTIAISVLFSAFNALTLSPALCITLLKPGKAQGPLHHFFDWFNRTFERSRSSYVRFSAMLIRKSAFSISLLVIVAGCGWLIAGKLPASFIPEEDQGYLMARLQLPQAASLERTAEASATAERMLRAIPGVARVATVNGYDLLSKSQNTYTATLFIALDDWSERRKPELQVKAILNQMNQRLSTIPEGVGFAFGPPAIPGVGTAGGVTFMLEDRSSSGTDFLAQNTDTYMAALRKRPEIALATTTMNSHVPQLYVDIDRDKVLRQHVNIDDVHTTLQTFMGGYFVNFFNRFGRQWQVFVEAESGSRADPKNIGQFYVTNAAGGMVPLDALANIKPTSGPEFIMRFNEYPAAMITVAAAPGYSSGQVMKAMEDVFAQTMPPQMGHDYMGMSFQEQKASKGVSPAVVFGFSLLFVFLILTALYESWSLPLSVLLVTPVAMFGGYLALLCRHMENNVYAQIGIVMLIGLASKDAILIVEFAKRERERGKSIVEAALTGARLRLRPILMTAFAFVLACVPLWMARGAGAQGRRVLGTTVIGGVLASMILAISLVPFTYTLFERLSARFTRQRESVGSEPQQIEEGR